MWLRCKSENGGGIAFGSASASLSVSACVFQHCTSTKTGAAICVCPAAQFTVTSSSFVSGNAETLDAGGIESLRISRCNYFHECTFIGNTAYRFSGGLVIAEIGTSACDNSFSAVVSECKFIGNKGEQGAGLHLRVSISSHYICNSLISSNTGTYGGGLQFWNDSIPSISPPSFSFLFFSSDSATKGHDIIINGSNPFTARSFIHCFSVTTNSPRIFPSGNENWLPQANIPSNLTGAPSINASHNTT